MIKTCLFSSGKLLSGGPELIDEWKKDPKSLIWLDLFDNTKGEETALLSKQFGLHALAIQDAQRSRHPPKIEAFDDYTFILLKGLSADSENIDFETIQLALFVGERFLVTRHTGPSMSINKLMQRIESGAESKYTKSTGQMALRLCRFVAERYINILLALEPRLEEIEEEMMEKADDSMLAELIQYKSDLKRLNRFALYHEQVFNELRHKDFPGFASEEVKHAITDVWEKQERTHSLSQLYYETSADMIDGYISVASHRLNQIMKILTIVMAIFVPLSFLAGIYGMNFENMPELNSKSGYFILLGIMGSIAAILLVLFRRMRWL